MFRADALAAHSRRVTHTRVMAMAAGRPWRASPTRASLPEALQQWYTQWSEARLEEAAHSARRHSRAHVAEFARCFPCSTLEFKTQRRPKTHPDRDLRCTG